MARPRQSIFAWCYGPSVNCCNSQQIIRKPIIKRASPLESCPAASCGPQWQKDHVLFHRRQGQYVPAIDIDVTPRVTGVLRLARRFTFLYRVTMRNAKRCSGETNAAQNNSAESWMIRPLPAPFNAESSRAAQNHAKVLTMLPTMPFEPPAAGALATSASTRARAPRCDELAAAPRDESCCITCIATPAATCVTSMLYSLINDSDVSTSPDFAQSND